MRWIVCIIGLLGVASAVFAEAGNRALGDAFERLKNPDPKIRAEAAKQIESQGQNARMALIKASQSRDPLIAGQAAEMLMKLPFYREDDSAKIKEFLADYHQLPAEGRIARVRELLSTKEAPEILPRLMSEDPDSDVSWMLGAYYAEQEDDFWQPLLACDLTDARPAVREAVARHLFFNDRAKACEMLKQIVQEDEAYPTMPLEKLQLAYQLLSADALVNGNIAEAQKYHRLLADLPAAPSYLNDGTEVAGPSSLTQMLAFYAGTGMIAGFGEDLVDNFADISRSENLYGLSRVFARPGLMPISAALERLGDNSLPNNIDERLIIGETISTFQWASPSIRVLEGVLAEAAKDPQRLARQQIRSVYALYRTAKELGDDAACIKYSRAMLQIPAELRGQDDTFEGQVIGHQLHAARKAGDLAALRTLTKDAVRISLANPNAFDADAGGELVNALIAVGDKAQAIIEFEKLYEQHRMRAATPGNYMQLNNLAWLCAGAGMRTKEAVEAADRAIRANPADWGTIDTAALAHFRAGNVKKAIELETFALALHPNDQFLLRELEWFKTGKPW